MYCKLTKELKNEIVIMYNIIEKGAIPIFIKQTGELCRLITIKKKHIHNLI